MRQLGPLQKWRTDHSARVLRHAGPKFDFKLRWFERLIRHAAELFGPERPVVLAGAQCHADDIDVYKPERWLDDARFATEARAAYSGLLRQDWTDALRTHHPGGRIYPSWDYFRNAFDRNAGLRIDRLLLPGLPFA
jgi:exodeoxyribonuclease-3